MNRASDKERALPCWRVRALLNYDQETGVFTYRVMPATLGARSTSKAGGHANGYIAIGIGGRKYYAHRLAWLWMTGEWPVEVVDHINGSRADNRWANLREATDTENHRNVGMRKCNRSGFKGVNRKRQSDRWSAQIRAGGKTRWLGTFNSPEEAHAAYLAAAASLHGQFARAA